MKKVLILAENGYEEFELWVPYYRFLEEGIAVSIVGKEVGVVYTGKHEIPVRADVSYDRIDVAATSAIVIPGGWAPDRLRILPEAVSLVKRADQQRVVIAAICHAGSLLVSADIVRGRTLTSYCSIRDDLRAAGALWVDEPVVVDKNLITARTPSDLPQFLPAVLAAIR